MNKINPEWLFTALEYNVISPEKVSSSPRRKIYSPKKKLKVRSEIKTEKSMPNFRKIETENCNPCLQAIGFLSSSTHDTIVVRVKLPSVSLSLHSLCSWWPSADIVAWNHFDKRSAMWNILQLSDMLVSNSRLRCRSSASRCYSRRCV